MTHKANKIRRASLAAALLIGCGTTAHPSTNTNDITAASDTVDADANNRGPAELRAQSDDTGLVQSFTPSQAIDHDNPFFVSLGTNGRACVSCHQAGQGWTVTPAALQARFWSSNGRDPIFRTNDGSTSPNADVSTLSARHNAYSMLLSKALIRVTLPVPAGADFALVAVDDPYNYAAAANLSLFRRPLPATNLAFVADVMWDGRENVAGGTPTDALLSQANDATLGHAQASAPLTSDQRLQIVSFEGSMFTAQVRDDDAGTLDRTIVAGGPIAVAAYPFYLGMNDPFSIDPSAFDDEAMHIFDNWEEENFPTSAPTYTAARAAVGRGQDLFYSKPISISGVAGLNDVLQQDPVQGTCLTCHNTPNVGSRSMSGTLNTGVADASRRTSDLPLYTFACGDQTVQTTDPGRALISGKCADIGEFKVPGLRALAARAPYFHNGAAAALSDVVDFYDTRFGIGFSDQEKSDLVAFLQSL